MHKGRQRVGRLTLEPAVAGAQPRGDHPYPAIGHRNDRSKSAYPSVAQVFRGALVSKRVLSHDEASSGRAVGLRGLAGGAAEELAYARREELATW